MNSDGLNCNRNGYGPSVLAIVSRGCMAVVAVRLRGTDGRSVRGVVRLDRASRAGIGLRREAHPVPADHHGKLAWQRRASISFEAGRLGRKEGKLSPFARPATPRRSGPSRRSTRPRWRVVAQSRTAGMHRRPKAGRCEPGAPEHSRSGRASGRGPSSHRSQTWRERRSCTGRLSGSESR